MPPTAPDFLVDIGSQPIDPATHLPLMEMAYSRNILEQRFNRAGGLNFFTPEVDSSWKNDLSMHQSIRLKFKGYRNPFNNVSVSAVTYTTHTDNQPATIDSTCEPGCVSTENKWNYVDVRFKNKFRIGVSWCVEEEALNYEDGETRFGESVSDAEVVTSTIGWSELITQALAAPSPKLIPNFTLSATHYFDAGSSDEYDVLTKVIQYMQRVFGKRWASEFAIIADPQLELDLLDHSSNIHAYNETGIATANGNVDELVAGGFQPMTAIPRLWKKQVLLAPDTVDFYPTEGAHSGDNLNPFGNQAGTKYYVVIVSKRAFFQGSAPLMNKKHFPATCDNKFDAIQQTWISFYKLLFPKEIFIVAFDRVKTA